MSHETMKKYKYICERFTIPPQDGSYSNAFVVIYLLFM